MLTERRIRDAKPGAKTILLRDTKVVGLAVRIAPGGTKSFVLDYRATGTRRLATLARCSEISLERRSGDGRPGTGRRSVRNDGADPVRDRQAAKAGGADRRLWAGQVLSRNGRRRRIEQGRADFRAAPSREYTEASESAPMRPRSRQS